jgi:hypothetical protein
LIDLAENALLPSTIRVVVCWQHGADEDLAAFDASGIRLASSHYTDGRMTHFLDVRGVAIELIDVPFQEASGAGWARSIAQQRYQGEEYNLQIDAHHRFAERWDVELIAMLESLKSISSKPLLTGHPPAFWPETYPDGRQEHPAVMVLGDFTEFGIVRFRSKLVSPLQSHRRPWRARFMSGGFVFSPGSFVRDVPQDPNHYFATEEVVMTVRAYTHGYDMFHPHRPLLWHYYGARSPKVWDDLAADPASGGHTGTYVDERVLASARRAMSLLGLSIEDGEALDRRFGLGMARTLLEYETYAGLSFSLRGVHESSWSSIEPEELRQDVDIAEWQAKLVCKRRIHVIVSFNPPEGIMVHSAHIVIRTTCGEVVIVRKLSDQEVDSLANGSPVAFIYEHASAPQGLPSAFAIQAVTNHADAQLHFSVAAHDLLD